MLLAALICSRTSVQAHRTERLYALFCLVRSDESMESVIEDERQVSQLVFAMLAALSEGTDVVEMLGPDW